MQHAGSALHGANGRTRFVLPGNQHRGPRSGLLRVFRHPGTQAAGARRKASRQPVRALHAASRSAQLPTTPHRPGSTALTRSLDTMRWSAPRSWVVQPQGLSTGSEGE